ncbi:MAG: hypothetical protein SOW20_04560 [Berryella intestinalis]|uniref:hypothetical protein n=1 Tax=Berryella intestinalis TaxID=1531429 RepID=UPI002A54F92C|nr:hypothetical protein [Berryella intestinalis]MDD7369719.1 hypothetical protein [Berryella intestinalis]MDY3129284.1 hypothetical protein [Berryella intestinalis]
MKSRLDALFGSETFASLYPDTQRPKVYLGFPTNEPPFYVAIDEVIDTAASSGAASMGHARIDFSVRVWCFARHAKQETASDTLLAYTDAVFKAVLADQRLNGAVDNSFPEIETAGTAADSSKRYTAAASIAVACHVYSQCPAELMEVVNESNQ